MYECSLQPKTYTHTLYRHSIWVTQICIYCSAFDVVIVYQQIMEVCERFLTFYWSYKILWLSVFPLVSCIKTHHPIVSCCGTKKDCLPPNYYNISDKSWKSTSLPDFRYVNTLVSKLQNMHVLYGTKWFYEMRDVYKNLYTCMPILCTSLNSTSVPSFVCVCTPRFVNSNNSGTNLAPFPLLKCW